MSESLASSAEQDDIVNSKYQLGNLRQDSSAPQSSLSPSPKASQNFENNRLPNSLRTQQPAIIDTEQLKRGTTSFDYNDESSPASPGLQQ